MQKAKLSLNLLVTFLRDSPLRITRTRNLEQTYTLSSSFVSWLFTPVFELILNRQSIHSGKFIGCGECTPSLTLTLGQYNNKTIYFNFTSFFLIFYCSTKFFLVPTFRELNIIKQTQQPKRQKIQQRVPACINCGKRFFFLRSFSTYTASTPNLSFDLEDGVLPPPSSVLLVPIFPP